MEEPLCETKGLSKDYILPDGHSLHVLEKMDIKIYPKEILAIIGPSGCGKSTFLRTLAGLIPPTKGKVYSHGKEITGLLPDFSMVFQNFALFPWMTVKQNIEIVLQTMDLTEKEIQEQTADAIAMIGLTGFEESYPRELSGGMKQRVGIARALVSDPELLILDEPFSALDTFTTQVLLEEILEIWESKANRLSSIILVSHDITEVVELASRIVMMESNPGRVQFVKLNKLSRPRDRRSTDFLNMVDELHRSYYKQVPSKGDQAYPLFPATGEEILGFLVHLRHSKDLYKIGAGNMDHFKRIMVSADAAELLQFIKIENRIGTLTNLGKRYLAADHQERRNIWKGQLLQIPLFCKAEDWLKSAPKHTISIEELTRLIAQELPHQDAQEQCKILLNWGSHGNLFTHHKNNTVTGS